MANKDFPRLVKRRRNKRRCTQDQLAREIGVSFSRVDLWENGLRRAQPHLANRLFERVIGPPLSECKKVHQSRFDNAQKLCRRKA